MWLVWESCTQHGKPSDGAQKKQVTEKNTTTPWPESILKLTNDHGGKGVESQELADYRELSVHSGEHHRLSTFFSFLRTLSCYSSYFSSSSLIFLERVPCPPFLTIYPLYSLWVKILEEKDNCSGVEEPVDKGRTNFNWGDDLDLRSAWQIIQRKEDYLDYLQLNRSTDWFHIKVLDFMTAYLPQHRPTMKNKDEKKIESIQPFLWHHNTFHDLSGSSWKLALKSSSSVMTSLTVWNHDNIEACSV